MDCDFYNVVKSRKTINQQGLWTLLKRELKSFKVNDRKSCLDHSECPGLSGISSSGHYSENGEAEHSRTTQVEIHAPLKNCFVSSCETTITHWSSAASQISPGHRPPNMVCPSSLGCHWPIGRKVGGNLSSKQSCHTKTILQNLWCLPSGKHTKNYGKSPFSMGKTTIDGHFQ